MSCSDCIRGGIHEGTPQGHEETLLGLPCYVTSPALNNAKSEKTASSPAHTSKTLAANTGHIVILTDAVGYKFVNTRLLADRYATRCNAKVYIPDFMNGAGVEPSLFESMDILFGHAPNAGLISKAGALFYVVGAMVPFLWFTRQAVCEPRINEWMRKFREYVGESDGRPIGAAGFCWGGKYAFLLSHSPEVGIKPIDCAFTAHPSNLVLPVDAKRVESPVCVVVGDKDPLLPVDKVREMEATLRGKKELGCEVTVLPGAAHGFAVRARPGDQEALSQGRKAEDIAVEWFKGYFSKSRKL